MEVVVTVGSTSYSQIITRLSCDAVYVCVWLLIYLQFTVCLSLPLLSLWLSVCKQTVECSISGYDRMALYKLYYYVPAPK